MTTMMMHHNSISLLDGIDAKILSNVRSIQTPKLQESKDYCNCNCKDMSRRNANCFRIQIFKLCMYPYLPTFSQSCIINIAYTDILVAPFNINQRNKSAIITLPFHTKQAKHVLFESLLIICIRVVVQRWNKSVSFVVRTNWNYLKNLLW